MLPDILGGFEFAWPFYAGALVAYLIGAIPFGLLLTRFAGLGDIRAIGSGNIGATNVLRTGRKGLAAATLVLDMAKGAVAVLVGAALFGSTMAWFAGLGVVLGHMFPLWLKFRGGKAVATALGVFLVAAWPVWVLACLTWLAGAALSRRSSVASLASIILAPVYAYLLSHTLRGALPPALLVDPLVVSLAVAIGGLVVIRHHANIGRLLRGEEPRIQLKK